MAGLPEGDMLEADVLVIGGGLAGCFAAIKARELGASVTVVEKGHVAYSGSNSSGIDHFPYCFIPDVHGRLGYRIEDFVRDQSIKANGVIDQELCEMMWGDSYGRLLDLEDVGVKIRFEKIYRWNFGYPPGDYPEDPKFRIVPWPGFSVPPALCIEGRHIKAKLDARLGKLGVRVLNHHHAGELLVTHGAVGGAMGFNIRTGDFFVVQAKSTVITTGSLSRLFPSRVLFDHLNPPNQTAEGQIMALEAGAELAIMEQYLYGSQRVRIGGPRLKNWMRSAPATPSGYPAGRIVNAAGEEMPNSAQSFDQSDDEELSQRQLEWFRRSVKEGKEPFYWDATMAREDERKYAEWSSAEEGGGVALFMHLEELGADLATHQIEVEKPIVAEPGTARGFLITSPSGVVINERAETTLPGLYAAGEVAYGQHFPSSPWAYATGARAGHNAAQRASEVGRLKPDDEQVRAGKDRLLAPLLREQGATWQELNLAINQVMSSYLRRSDYSLTAGLQRIEELRSEVVRAYNPHELMRCTETRSLLAVAELFLLAMSHPRQRGEWRVATKSDGVIHLSTRPIKYKYPLDRAVGS